MICSYYLWKWATNDLPGKPSEVFADLMSGIMHPALQPFDARPLLQCLDALATVGRSHGEEWVCQVYPQGEPHDARFIILQGPEIDATRDRRERFLQAVYPFDVSGFDEQRGGRVECLLPKLNVFEFGEWPEENHHDISLGDLPVLLRRIRAHSSSPYGILTNRQNHFVQCYAERNGFKVEWRINCKPTSFDEYDQWCAGLMDHPSRTRPPRHVVRPRFHESEYIETHEKEYPHENLRFADVLRIFEAFLRGEPRPSQYDWRSIRTELEEAKHPTKGKLPCPPKT